MVEPEEAEELAVGAVGPEEELAVDVVVEVGQEVAAALVAAPRVAAGQEVAAAAVAARRVAAVVVAARRVAAAEALADPVIAVAWEVLTRIIPAALLSATTRWLPYRILFARRTASGA